METWEELQSTFDRGLNYGIGTLSAEDQELFFIQSFIIDYEMGGWLYNWIPKWLKFDATIAAMRTRGLNELSDIISEVKVLFQAYDHIDAGRSRRASVRRIDEQCLQQCARFSFP